MTFYFSVLTVAFRMWLLPPFKFRLACITWTLFQILANPHFDTHNNRTDSYLFLHIIRNSHHCLRNRVDKSGELILFCVTFVYALGSMLSIVRLWDLYRSTSRSNEKGKSRKSDCSSRHASSYSDACRPLCKSETDAPSVLLVWTWVSILTSLETKEKYRLSSVACTRVGLSISIAEKDGIMKSKQ